MSLFPGFNNALLIPAMTPACLIVTLLPLFKTRDKDNLGVQGEMEKAAASIKHFVEGIQRNQCQRRKKADLSGR